MTNCDMYYLSKDEPSPNVNHILYRISSTPQPPLDTVGMVVVVESCLKTTKLYISKDYYHTRLGRIDRGNR